MTEEKTASNKGYGYCGKCGKHLTPKELRYGSTMCDQCRKEIFEAQRDNEGWI
jgi:NADH pyrophosphatase NudC (nudix superfamily)